MKKYLPAIILIAVCALNCEAQQTQGKEASFDDQLRAMGYFIYSLSGINAINGINLSVEQAKKLRTLASEVQAVTPPLPDLNAPYRADLGEVRDTYQAVRKEILKGAEVGPDLEVRTAKARGVESQVIRLSVKNAQRSSGGCVSCHIAPEAPDVRSLNDKAPITENGATASSYERYMAHLKGLFGQQGVAKIAKLAPEVDQILNDEQKDIFDSFSCCLVPPKSLKDPVRAGQAGGGERQVDHLRNARAVPAANWPQAKARLMELLDKGLMMRTAKVTEDTLRAAHEKAGEIYEKARSLSDMDFELQKDALAAELQGASQQKTAKGGNKSFQTAVFLLAPGSLEVYDTFIERQKKGQATP